MPEKRSLVQHSSLQSQSLLLTLLLLLSGCSQLGIPSPIEPQCKIRTYISLGLEDYIKSRYDSTYPIQAAVLPFSVPESFSPSFGKAANYGRVMAREVQAQLHATGMFRIVELFDRGSWPGKRAEFFAGSHEAIEMSRNAGYDMLVLGYLEEVKNDSEMVVFSRIIDTRSGVTVWYGRTIVVLHKRFVERELSRTEFYKERPDKFYFDERAEKYARCTVKHLGEAEPVP